MRQSPRYIGGYVANAEKDEKPNDDSSLYLHGAADYYDDDLVSRIKWLGNG
ncbi:hypothetical protein ACTXGQ_09870 [Marinobacter sp. 1Y8]